MRLKIDFFLTPPVGLLHSSNIVDTTTLRLDLPINTYTMDTFEDIDILDIVPIIVLGAVDTAKATEIPRSTGLPGGDYLRELLNCGNEKRIYEVLRMKRDTFSELYLWLRKKSNLKDSRYILIEEQVAMFLWTINYSASMRVVAERFQHSTEPVSR